jgi:uncharacterized protein YndB with AHSA1/START domain
MAKKLVAQASATLNAPATEVWDALIKPERIKRYMFGTTVVSDFKPGSPITFKGEWEGKPYEDKGVIQKVEPLRRLQYTHFSPLSGQPDVPESYHTVTIELAEQGKATKVTLSQDNNATEKEKTHSEKNWAMMLEGLKQEVKG